MMTSNDTSNELRPHDWEKMSTVELYGQLSILQQRLITVAEMKKPEMVGPIQQGIDRLQILINKSDRIGVTTVIK